MNENNGIALNSVGAFLNGLTSGDKAFVLLLISLVSAYVVKRYFDSTDKAMEHGYNTSVFLPKYGNVKFTRGAVENEEPVPDQHEAPDAKKNDTGSSIAQTQ